MKSRVRLYSSDTFAVSWERLLLPWFQAAAADAWKQKLPSLVAVPFRNHAYFLKSLLMDVGLSAAGIHFVSPADLRARLLQQRRIAVPLREHLRLLLSIAAEQSATERREFPAAKAVARAPDHLLHAIDQLNAGGWPFPEKGPPEVRPVFRQFEILLEKCNFTLIHDADRAALSQRHNSEPLFERLLVTGFDAAHWPLWPLLRASTAAAVDATIVLTDPRERARDLDECWIGTWEESFGAAEPLAAADAEIVLPFAELSAQTTGACGDVHFLVGRTTTEQAEAIAAMTVKFLGEKSCQRLGILFRGPGALARQVAALLRDAGVAHNDGIAQLAPGPFEDAAWRAWLALQEEPQLASLLAFQRAHPAADELFEKLSVEKIGDILERAYNDVLIDDLAVLREYCALQTPSSSLIVAQGLARLRFLPASATFAAFISGTKKIFAQLGWDERSAELARFGEDCKGLDAEFSRSIFLRWLSEITVSTYAVRDDFGSHPYSRVHLLPFAQADAQQWSHLILAGLNQGEWPPPEDDSGFLREQDIDELNREIKKLNRRAVRQGSQGEGHVSVIEGKTLCLGPVEQRQLALRSLWNLIESTSAGLALTASLYDETAPERFRNPSEFFTHVYFQARGKALSQETMKSLRETTRAWLDENDLFTRSEKSDGIEQTRAAYDERREPDIPAGKYEFAMETPPSREITMSATDWGKAMRSPAIVWMKMFLGVEGGAGESGSWSLATGQWVHRWLAAVSSAAGGNELAEFPPAAEMARRVRGEANAFRTGVEQLLASCGKTAPDWWRSGWENAIFLADSFAQKLSQVTDWPLLAAEWNASGKILFGASRELRLRGRIDLLLVRPSFGQSSLDGAEAWLIDYKTGNTKGIVSEKAKTAEARDAAILKKLQSGDAMQIALYALALRQFRAAKVSANLVSRAADFTQSPISVDDMLKHETFWAELRRMQDTGIFGGRGAIRDEFGFAGDYPVATLPIDRDLVEEKWVLTHPAFAGANGEEDE